MTLEEIKELIQAVLDSGIAELEVQRGDNRVRIRRSGRVYQSEISIPAGSGPAAHTPRAAQPPSGLGAFAADAASDDSLVLVKAPIVGTFYEAPSPQAPPFVKVGDTVQPGQVLCIIESMKLMNEIESEIAGVVAARLVENTHPVEYGEALFSIRPL